ncbi:MAG: DUF2390 domain-containing protein [Glaciecola sp.]|jgi:uncharacterized protein (TIGR02444 family)
MPKVISAADFWHWSGTFYQLPDVAPSLLAWQNHCHGQVNAVLWILYLWTQDKTLPVSAYAELDVVITRSHAEDVGPIRELRMQTAKDDPQYRTLLQAELSAEQRQQALLVEQTLPHVVDGAEDITNALTVYLEWHTARHLTAAQQTEVQALLAALVTLLVNTLYTATRQVDSHD